MVSVSGEALIWSDVTFWHLSFDFELLTKDAAGNWAVLEGVTYAMPPKLGQAGSANIGKQIRLVPQIQKEFEATTAIRQIPGTGIHVTGSRRAPH